MLLSTALLVALLCLEVLGYDTHAVPHPSRKALRQNYGRSHAHPIQGTQRPSYAGWHGNSDGAAERDSFGTNGGSTHKVSAHASVSQEERAIPFDDSILPWRMRQAERPAERGQASTHLTVSLSVRMQDQRAQQRASGGPVQSSITAAAWTERQQLTDDAVLFRSNGQQRAHVRVRIHRRPQLPLNSKLPLKKFAIDLPQALSFAQLQSTVYCNMPDILKWNCTRCDEDGVLDFQQHKVHFDPDWDVLGMTGFWPKWNATFVVFRGTDSTNLGNWIHNMNVLKTAYYPLPYPGYENAMVHHGFFSCFNASSLATQINESLVQLLEAHPGVPVYFMGHSLGAAMATIAAPYMKVVHNLKDARLWTFGSPRVGNLMFATLVASVVDESVRFTHSHDIVPSLPLPLFGYHHVAREVWQLPPHGDDDDIELRICDRSGEDPRCHNSACILGLCRSIIDHVLYLGKHMYHNEDEC